MHACQHCFARNCDCDSKATCVGCVPCYDAFETAQKPVVLEPDLFETEEDDYQESVNDAYMVAIRGF